LYSFSRERIVSRGGRDASCVWRVRIVDWSWGGVGCYGDVACGGVRTRLVVFSVLVEELFAEGVFDAGRFGGFAEDAEVGLIGAEGEGCAGVGADALGAAHCGRWVSIARGRA
jgi:hypothetical protein